MSGRSVWRDTVATLLHTIAQCLRQSVCVCVCACVRACVCASAFLSTCVCIHASCTNPSMSGESVCVHCVLWTQHRRGTDTVSLHSASSHHHPHAPFPPHSDPNPSWPPWSERPRVPGQRSMSPGPANSFNHLLIPKASQAD